MYRNWFTELFMSDVAVIKFFGVLKWYDMFSLRGFDNWFWDAQSLIWIPLWELWLLYQRDTKANFQYNTVE